MATLKPIRQRGVKFAFNQHQLENYRDLLLVLFQKEFKVRYKGKFLGYLWSIASPLAFAMVYYIAFSGIMRVAVEGYPLILVSGLFPWQWFQNSVGSAPNLFVGNASLIKKLNFPRNILSLSTILNHMVHFLLSLPVILIFMVIYGKSPTLAWLYGLPVMMVVQLFTVYGLALVLATLNLFLRDIERLTQIVMTFVFYFTPIIFTADMIPERFRPLIPLNPAAPLMINWRNLFLHGYLDGHYLLISAGYAVAFFIIGTLVYRKLSWKFAEVL
ncbi:ABC transporter permease [Thermoleptolyngbya sp. C42_A2020_037]|uniref:ABC transporter permease n=1 Tax=Thermoleptolyngbya sp. C42_A2020_037 TaxID=2747799 RepID=UPI0019FD4A36|nr:ABC transporter permease [Thermoleptolyngbya sp. C42_A2020_037]MBF2085080.1 ABC transporter permease [Thermoleptolyngbya sp. C42_A2020_037]